MKKMFSMVGVLVLFLSVMACKKPVDSGQSQADQIKLITEKAEAMGLAGQKAETSLNGAASKAAGTGLTQEDINGAKTAVMAYKTSLQDYLTTVQNIAAKNGNAGSEKMKKLTEVMNKYIVEIDAVIALLSEANVTDKKAKVTEAKTKFGTATKTWSDGMRQLL